MVVLILCFISGFPRSVSSPIDISAFICLHSISSICASFVPAITTCDWLVRLVRTIWSKEVIMECPRLTPFKKKSSVDGSLIHAVGVTKGI